MADKFRYSIDLGSGLTLLSNVYDNNLRLRFGKDDSLMVSSGSISGSITIIGTEAVNAWARRLTSYYAPFLIEEWNGSVWNDLFECNIDLRGEFLELSEVLTMNNFQEAESQETNILANIKKTFKTNELGLSQTTISQTITPTQFDVVSGPTALNVAQYIAAFNIENNQVLVADTRWNYFSWQSTTGVSPALIHTWSTRSFLYRPGTQTNLNGYTEILVGATTMWVQLPPQPYTGAGFSAQLTSETYLLDEVLDAIVSAFDATLSFDNADAGDFTFSSVCYLGDGNDFNNTEITGIEITFEKIIQWLNNFYAFSWYIDSNKLKFELNAYKFSNSLLNWSSEMTNNDKSVNAYNPMPDRERWDTGDKNIDRFLISYFGKDIKTDDNVINYTIDIMQDFWEILKGGLSSNKLVWVRLTGGGVVVESSMQDYFDNSYISASFCGYDRFTVPTDPAAAYGVIPIAQSDTRPVLSLKHSKWINDYSAFDLLVRINTGIVLGYLNSYEIDLNTGLAIFDLWHV